MKPLSLKVFRISTRTLSATFVVTVQYESCCIARKNTQIGDTALFESEPNPSPAGAPKPNLTQPNWA